MPGFIILWLGGRCQHMRGLWTLLAAATLLSRQQIRLTDIPTGLRPILSVTDADSSDSLLRQVEQDTRKRLNAGEDEHLVYFILQSNTFTKRRRVEPALSAKHFSEQGS